MNQITQLLIRPSLLPDETLISYLYRLGRANLLSLGQLSSLIKSHLENGDAYYAPTHTNTYTVLSKLTGLETYKIYCGTKHSFLSLVSEIGKNVDNVTLDSGITVPLLRKGENKILKRNNLQFCPYCLQEETFQRRAWIFQQVSACIDHQCLLIDKCPTCARDLDLDGIMNGKCTRCEFPITNAEAISIAQDIKGLKYQKLLYFWINSGPPIDLPLVSEPKQTLYAMALSIIEKIFLSAPPLEDLHRIPDREEPKKVWGWRNQSLEQIYIAWTTAIDALINWPENFQKFINCYMGGRDRPLNPMTMGLVSHWLGTWIDLWPREKHPYIYPGLDECVSMFCTWKTTPFRNQYYSVTENKITIEHPMLTRFKWVEIKEAQASLKVSSLLLSLMLKQGLFNTKNATGHFTKSDLLLCEDVLRLKKRWIHNIPRKDVSKILGISKEFCLGLIEAQVLEGTNELGEYGVQFVELESINRLLEQLYRYSRFDPYRTSPRSFFTLDQAIQLLAPYNYDAVTLIKLATNGELQANYRRGKPLGEVLFYKSALSKLTNKLATRGKVTACGKISQRKGVQDSVVLDWSTVGFLHPPILGKTSYYFYKKEAEEFEIKYASLPETLRILAIEEQTLLDWIKEGKLNCVSGPHLEGGPAYLFRRQDVYKLRLSDLITRSSLKRTDTRE